MLGRVYTADERPFDEVDHLGIVITSLCQEPGQQHVGILHKNADTGEVRTLHLAWHYELRNSEPKSSYAWIDLPILSRRARQVAAHCRRIFKANGSRVPYAFSQYVGCFDEKTGVFLTGTDRRGLTCASFVLAVFHSAGLFLIQSDTWPANRDGDVEWQWHIIKQLKEHGASVAHIRDVKSGIGFARYRPEDVAGAGAADSVPTPFAIAQPLAEKILKKLSDNNLYT